MGKQGEWTNESTRVTKCNMNRMVHINTDASFTPSKHNNEEKERLELEPELS